MVEEETVTPFCVAIIPHCCEPSSAEVSARERQPSAAGNRNSAGRAAARVPANDEPSDTDAEKVATVVSAGELSGRGVVVVTKVMPVGVGNGGSITLILKVAVSVNRSFIPTARTRTG
jgi:hypothetical protein